MECGRGSVFVDHRSLSHHLRHAAFFAPFASFAVKHSTTSPPETHLCHLRHLWIKPEDATCGNSSACIRVHPWFKLNDATSGISHSSAPSKSDEHRTSAVNRHLRRLAFFAPSASFAVKHSTTSPPETHLCHLRHLWIKLEDATCGNSSACIRVHPWFKLNNLTSGRPSA